MSDRQQSVGARPGAHWTAPSGWMNDPHGITYREGLYHLFYQAVPNQLHWGPRCSWGHATSADLVSWTSQGLALTPGDGDDGCWSGSILETEDGSAILFYTSADIRDPELGRIRVAHPTSPTWAQWRKGPIAVRPPVGVVSMFRD